MIDHNPTTRVKGTLNPDGTLELHEAPALPAGPVEVTIRPMLARSPLDPNGQAGENLIDWVERVRAEAAAAGYRFQTNEEMEADVAEIKGWTAADLAEMKTLEKERQSSKLDDQEACKVDLR